MWYQRLLKSLNPLKPTMHNTASILRFGVVNSNRKVAGDVCVRDRVAIGDYFAYFIAESLINRQKQGVK